MKRVVTAIVVAVFVVGLVPRPADAAPAQAEPAVQTILKVSGHVTDNGHPSSGSLVTLSCDGHYVEVTRTDTTGYYLFDALDPDCDTGSTIGVFAYGGGRSGSGSGVWQGNPLVINVAITGIPIPEYDWIGGVLASGAGIGAIMFARRHLLKN